MTGAGATGLELPECFMSVDAARSGRGEGVTAEAPEPTAYKGSVIMSKNRNCVPGGWLISSKTYIITLNGVGYSITVTTHLRHHHLCCL
jgi:hypothetical protein